MISGTQRNCVCATGIGASFSDKYHFTRSAKQLQTLSKEPEIERAPELMIELLPPFNPLV